MKKIELHKDLFLVEDFLSADECQSYINFSQTQTFEEAKVNMFGRQVTHKGIRNNDRLMFFDQDLADSLWQRVQEFVPERMGIYKALGLNEMFRIYRYTEGQQFKMHRDGSYHRNDEECSFISFIIYLNEDFEGGETEFRNLETIVPKTGTALLFQHSYRHEGKAVLSGTKYVLRTDIMYKLES
ncbi:MAG: 2OG-Fe(II) oxygenase [Bacteroidota bacterium]